MLERIKTLLGLADESKDALLTLLIADSEQEFTDYCNRSDIPASAQPLVAQMTVIRYRRLNTEGLASQSFSGVSESFTDGYPANILSQLNRYRKLRVM